MSDDIETIRDFLRIHSPREDHLGDRAKDATAALDSLIAERDRLQRCAATLQAADYRKPEVRDFAHSYLHEILKTAFSGIIAGFGIGVLVGVLVGIKIGR